MPHTPNPPSSRPCLTFSCTIVLDTDTGSINTNTTKVRNVGTPAWSILAVTFTKKASEEMRARVRKALGEEVSGQVMFGSVAC